MNLNRLLEIRKISKRSRISGLLTLKLFDISFKKGSLLVTERVVVLKLIFLGHYR